ncbi:MAG: HAD family hydrolase [Clostridium sp.]
MITTLVFDFHGTLTVYGDIVTAQRDTNNILYNFISSTNNQVGFDEVVDRWNRVFNSEINDKYNSEYSVFNKKIELLLNEFKVSYNYEQIKGLSNQCLDSWHSYITQANDLEETLGYLKQRYKLGLVSNFDHPNYVRELLIKYGVYDMFDSIIISGDIGLSKPNIKVFEKSLEELNSHPAKVCFIGDDLICDIKGARQAGMHTMLIDRDKHYSDYTGLKVQELSDITEKLKDIEGGFYQIDSDYKIPSIEKAL